MMWLMVAGAGLSFAGKAKKPAHPEASACTSGSVRVCVENANYWEGFRASVYNPNNFAVGRCSVKFLVRNKSGEIVAAPEGETSTGLGPNERQSIVSEEISRPWPPVEDVELSCSSADISERLHLAWPIFSNSFEGWSYAHKRGYR